jgi:hypothetical protein
MTLRDGFFNCDFKDAFYARELSDDDITGECIDTQGYESLTFVVAVGRLSTITSVSYLYFRMQHTDASALGAGPSDYAYVSADDVIGLSVASLTSGIWKSFHTATATALSQGGSAVYPIGYRGNKRYVRIVVDCFSTPGDASDAIAGIAILGLPANWPVQSDQAVSYGGS